MKNEKARDRIFIGVSSDGWINSYLTAWLIARCDRHPFDPIQIHDVFIPDRKYFETNAAAIVDRFLKSSKCTHLLFIDNDVTPDNTLIDRMVKYEKDIVGSAILMWRPEFDGPMTNVARKNLKNPGKYIYIDTARNNEDKPIRKVDFVGFGCILVKRHVIEGMEKPYFVRTFDNDGNLIKSAEMNFCEKAIDNGHEVYVDQVEAIGQIVEINLEDVLVKMMKLE